MPFRRLERAGVRFRTAVQCGIREIATVGGHASTLVAIASAIAPPQRFENVDLTRFERYATDLASPVLMYQVDKQRAIVGSESQGREVPQFRAVMCDDAS